MKIFFLVPYPLRKGPNIRFRLECYLPYLAREGIQCIVRPFASERLYSILFEKGYFIEKVLRTLAGYWFRLGDFLKSLRYDCIVIYRETSPFGPAILPLLWKIIGKKVIFDFDDAIYLRSSSDVNRLTAFLKCPSKTKTLIQASSAVIVGNRHLYQYAQQYHSNVMLIPTPIDTSIFISGTAPQKAHSSNNDKIRIGWVGSRTTLAHFYLLSEILQRLSQKYPIETLVLGARNVTIPKVEVISLEWELGVELDILRSFDIGVMPLPNDEWSQGKCGFKLLQYMSMNIPTVSSPVGVNVEIIQDGQNGFLAANLQEWIQKISRLIEDKDLRKRIGMAGRHTVEERYSLKRWYPQFVKLIKGKLSDSNGS